MTGQATGPDQQSQQPPAESEEQAEDEPSAAFDAEQDSRFNELLAPIPQAAFDKALALGIGQVAAGDTAVDKAASALASYMGLDPGTAATLAEHGVAYYTAATQRAVQAVGVPAEHWESFSEFARARPQSLYPALQKLTMGRDASGFTALAQEYLATAARAAGVNR